MLGNVWQRCEDLQHDNYDGAPVDGEAWILNTYFSAKGMRFRQGHHMFQAVQVTRGGSWHENATSVRSSQRYMVQARQSYNDLGFRIVAEERTH